MIIWFVVVQCCGVFFDGNDMKQQIGLIGVGLMGYGIVCNVLKYGYLFMVVEYLGNQLFDELLQGGVWIVWIVCELVV